MTEYKVVVDKDITKLQFKVNVYIQCDGWECQGGITCYAEWWAQALTREKKEKK